MDTLKTLPQDGCRLPGGKPRSRAFLYTSARFFVGVHRRRAGLGWRSHPGRVWAGGGSAPRRLRSASEAIARDDRAGASGKSIVCPALALVPAIVPTIVPTIVPAIVPNMPGSTSKASGVGPSKRRRTATAKSAAERTCAVSGNTCPNPVVHQPGVNVGFRRKRAAADFELVREVVEAACSENAWIKREQLHLIHALAHPNASNRERTRIVESLVHTLGPTAAQKIFSAILERLAAHA